MHGVLVHRLDPQQQSKSKSILLNSGNLKTPKTKFNRCGREKMSGIQESDGSLLATLKKSFHLTDYSRILNPDKPLPSRNSAVVREFIAADPIYGPVLKTTTDAAEFAYLGAFVGAVATGGNAWRWSKSLHGAALSLAFGGVVGFTLGAEVANHWYQLYRLDTVGAQVKFNEWLQKRA